jgi:hypothetical protein
MKTADGRSKIAREYLRKHVIDIDLTPEQIAEIKRRMSDREPFATDREVRRTFARLTKPRKKS